MIPVRRNIDTDELIMWLDPSSPLSYKTAAYTVGIAGKGKNQFAGTTDFTNTGTSIALRTWNGSVAGINKATVANEPLVTDPRGDTETTAFIETAETGTKFLTCRIELATPSGSNGLVKDKITYSLYVKQGPGSDRNIRISHTNAGPAATLVFDFTTNTITSSINVDDSGSEDVGGGWYRIWYTDTVDTASNLYNVQARTFIYLVDAGGNLSYTGNGTSGVYIYGPQWEQGVLSNYVKRPPASEFKYFQNNKFVKVATDPGPLNPKGYTTTFEGTNFRFSGVHSGLYGGGDIRFPFRPDPDSLSLQDHSGFAWVKLDGSGIPTDGFAWSPSTKVYTALGNIGGKANNGVFGIEENGTSLVYKMRVVNSLGTTPSPVLQSSSFPNLDGEWHLIAFSFNFSTSTVDFYLDGALISSETIANAPITSISGGTGSVTIGYFQPTNFSYPCGQFKGLMNTVGFYNKTLSSVEQKALYDATKYRFV